jgi:Tfp pilus assembly PilM family ATPase
MARSFPPDVVVIDTDALLHARFGRGKSNPRLVQSKAYRLAADTFTPALVTPQLVNESALTETLRRMRGETGKWDKVSILLPDSWFRINIVDLPSLPDKPAEALEVVRWSLKRTLPIPPDQLRVAYSILSRNAQGAKVLVLSALEATLASSEKVFTAAGIDVVLVEPLGLNIWNAITVREGESADDRLFLYVRDTDFTTAVFRGAQPLFIRSRNLSGERSVEQEIRLSANYLRDTLSVESFAQCYVAGARGSAVHETLASEFNTQVRPVVLRDFVEEAPADLQGDLERFGAELTACTGVFTG